VARGAVIGPKLGAHVSKQDEDWTLWSSMFKDLKGVVNWLFKFYCIVVSGQLAKLIKMNK